MKQIEEEKIIMHSSLIPNTKFLALNPVRMVHEPPPPMSFGNMLNFSKSQNVLGSTQLHHNILN